VKRGPVKPAMDSCLFKKIQGGKMVLSISDGGSIFDKNEGIIAGN